MVQQNSPFIASTITLCFLFSTMYGLAFLYYQGTNQQLGTDSGINAFTNNDPQAQAKNTAVQSGGVFGFVISVVDGVLEAVSWISPIGLIKGFFTITGLNTGVPEIYQLFNLFIMRPLGWAMALITINYIISRIPTEHGE